MWRVRVFDGRRRRLCGTAGDGEDGQLSFENWRPERVPLSIGRAWPALIGPRRYLDPAMIGPCPPRHAGPWALDVPSAGHDHEADNADVKGNPAWVGGVMPHYRCPWHQPPGDGQQEPNVQSPPQ